MSINRSTFMTGLFVGGVVGAAAATLYAPRPGKAYCAIRERRAARTQEPLVDDQLDQSFPASDPPSWTPVTSTNPS